MDITSIQLISIAVSGVLGLGGVIIAGLSAYWARSERIEPLKQKLYERQLSGAAECISALAELQSAIDHHRREIGYPEYFENDQQRKSFIAATEALTGQLKLSLYRSAYVLPQEVFAPMTQYISVIEYASGARDVIESWAGSGYPTGDPWYFLSRYFLESVSAVREFLGFDPLSAQLSSTIGVSEEERKKEVEDKTLALAYLMSNDYRPYLYYQDGYRVTRLRRTDGHED